MTGARLRDTARVDLAALTARCRRRLAELDLPDPFDVRRLCAAVAQRRGRPITLLGLALPPEGPYGLWIALRGRDCIVYEAATSPLHQEHIIVHELSHLLLGHNGSSQLSDHQVGRLFPRLDPEMVRRVLGRSDYSTLQEREAELLASMIVQRAERSRGRSSLPDPAVAARLERLEAGI
jgi:hypothetical protein